MVKVRYTCFFAGLGSGLVLCCLLFIIYYYSNQLHWFQILAQDRIEQYKFQNSLIEKELDYPLPLLKANIQTDLALVKKLIEISWFNECNDLTNTIIEEAKAIEVDATYIPNCYEHNTN